jgi:hypothetical protein
MTKPKSASSKKMKKKSLRNIIPNQLYAVSFAREQKVKMRYHETIYYTLSGAVSDDSIFNLNSIFDPNRSGVGHQPQGYDQWSAFYGRYRVDACKVTTRIIGSNGDGLYITILGTNSTTAMADPIAAIESPLSTTGVYSPGGPTITLSRHFDLAILNGVTKSVYKNDDRYQAIMGANPTETIILHVVASDAKLAAKTAVYDVLLEYDVTMFDPVQLAQS